MKVTKEKNDSREEGNTMMRRRSNTRKTIRRNIQTIVDCQIIIKSINIARTIRIQATTMAHTSEKSGSNVTQEEEGRIELQRKANKK